MRDRENNLDGRLEEVGVLAPSFFRKSAYRIPWARVLLKSRCWDVEEAVSDTISGALLLLWQDPGRDVHEAVNQAVYSVLKDARSFYELDRDGYRHTVSGLKEAAVALLDAFDPLDGREAVQVDLSALSERERAMLERYCALGGPPRNNRHRIFPILAKEFGFSGPSGARKAVERIKRKLRVSNCA